MIPLILAIRTTTTARINIRAVETFIRCAARQAHFPAGYELSVALVGRQAMKTFNTRYRGKPQATNVLSFEYNPHCGEIVLCVPVIQRQAKAKGVSFQSELVYLTNHALVHLTGLDHEQSESQARRMEAKEYQIMQLCYPLHS